MKRWVPLAVAAVALLLYTGTPTHAQIGSIFPCLPITVVGASGTTVSIEPPSTCPQSGLYAGLTWVPMACIVQWIPATDGRSSAGIMQPVPALP